MTETHTVSNSRNSKKSMDSELVIALVGNPNVGKSTVFNQLTGMKQHTGNWAGKTVELATGCFESDKGYVRVIDLPGSYSLATDTPEEKITNDYIVNGKYDCLVIVADSTCLERNLNLVIQILMLTNKAVLCLNFNDELAKKGISIDTDELSLQLGIPVVGVSARYKRGIKELVTAVIEVANGNRKTYTVHNISSLKRYNDDYEEISAHISELSRNICNLCVGSKGVVYREFDRKLDKILLSPITGIPVMLLMFAAVFWLTAFGANYPGQLLSSLFNSIGNFLNEFIVILGLGEIIRSLLIDGVYTTVSWVVSVMLPPAMIFFPLFAILEDTGILPRFAFNLDRLFSKAGTNGKHALTMLMGFGCNACGVMGCRIIRSKKERLCAIVTNSFIPCNGRLPTLIALISVFFCTGQSNIYNSLITTAVLMTILIVAVIMTFAVSWFMSRIMKDENSGCFILELPPYRKPQFMRGIFLSVKDKVLYVLSRAIMVSVPAGAIIWLLSNIKINGVILLGYMAEYLDPLAIIMGIDGIVLSAVILSFPANEIMFPTAIMAYTSGTTLTEYSSITELGTILYENGWTWITALCTIILCVFHFPCSTTVFSIKKETGSVFWTTVSIFVPLVIGIVMCIIVNSVINHIF